jgi:hypothetical protein
VRQIRRHTTHAPHKFNVHGDHGIMLIILRKYLSVQLTYSNCKCAWHICKLQICLSLKAIIENNKFKDIMKNMSIVKTCKWFSQNEVHGQWHDYCIKVSLFGFHTKIIILFSHRGHSRLGYYFWVSNGSKTFLDIFTYLVCIDLYFGAYFGSYLHFILHIEYTDKVNFEGIGSSNISFWFLKGHWKVLSKLFTLGSRDKKDNQN